MKISLFLLFQLFLFSPSIYSQISFIDQSALYLDSVVYYTNVIAVCDLDNDGLDDLSLMNLNRNLVVHYQNESNQTFERKTLANIGNIPFSICVANLNNEGQNEVFTGGVYQPMKIISTENIDGDTSLYGILPQSEEIFLQGCNVVDIDNDGNLDIFACHDDGANYIWENDGEGQFNVNTDWIDFSVNGSIAEPASGNYGSIWTDIDLDGDLDLYIAKCRSNVTDTTDVRRINRLYKNNGDGTFTEKAEEAGLDISWQSWTADFQDINNDGFLDVFITNHDYNSQLLLNDGNGVFTELHNTGINTSTTIGQKVFQGIMRDFDNDGWVDIFTAGSFPQFFINNHDNTFTELIGDFTDEPVRTFAIGDLNGDGYVDIYAGNSFGGDQIWINSAESENNHLSVRLQGTISNKNAIGARVEIYGNWGIQVREVRSGESYGIMNSMTQYFGLGNATTVDSVIVRWPSGTIQTEYEVEINSKIFILEECFFQAPELNFVVDTIICHGDSLILSIDGEFDQYFWNNGSSLSEITVNSSGIYFVDLVDKNGCTATSKSINIQLDSILAPEIEVIGATNICKGEDAKIVFLNALDIESQMWSTGSQEDTLSVNESGVYYYIQENACGTFSSNEIEISVDIELSPEIVNLGEMHFCEGEQTVIVFINDQSVENQSWSTGFQGDSLIVNESGVYTFIQENACGTFISNEIGISVYLNPEAPNTINDTIKKGEIAVLNAEGTDISWYPDYVSQEAISTGNELEIPDLEETTTFYASQSSGNGLCESERAPALVFVEDELSDNLGERIQVLQIFPNPVNGILNINLKKSIDLPAALEIYDVSSRLISQKNLLFHETSYNVNEIEKGVYIVMIRGRNSVYSKRIIIY